MEKKLASSARSINKLYSDSMQARTKYPEEKKKIKNELHAKII